MMWKRLGERMYGGEVVEENVGHHTEVVHFDDEWGDGHFMATDVERTIRVDREGQEPLFLHEKESRGFYHEVVKFRMSAGCCDVCRNLEKCRRLDDKMRKAGTWKWWQVCSQSECNRYRRTKFGPTCAMRCVQPCTYHGDNHNTTYKFDGPMTGDEVREEMARIMLEDVL